MSYNMDHFGSLNVYRLASWFLKQRSSIYQPQKLATY